MMRCLLPSDTPRSTTGTAAKQRFGATAGPGVRSALFLYDRGMENAPLAGTEGDDEDFVVPAVLPIAGEEPPKDLEDNVIPLFPPPKGPALPVFEED